jgi:hypothetical protein
MNLTPRGNATYWYTAALTIFALLFFARSFSNYFVCDDYQFLDRVNFSNAGDYLTKSWGYGNEYRPFLPYTYAWDAYISGSNPSGYHITNTLLHTANSLLIAAMTALLGLSRRTAALAGLTYLLNPVAHESVLWISGRPVVLATFFILASCFLCLKALQTTRFAFWYWTGVYALFILGLFTYELAIVTPLLAVLLARLAKHDRRTYQKHFVGLLGIAGVYGLFWNWFFEFRFTRIQIEHSLWQVASNFGDALAHSLHGIMRLEVAPVYILLLANLCRTRNGRTWILLGMAWFVIGYLPYFAVKGYADRFVYLSSGATAVVLAVSVVEGIRRKSVQYTAALIVLGFFGTGMQNRITAWKEAGDIARAIPREIRQELPIFPADRQVVLLNVPLMHKRSYVYLTSLDRALEREYRGGTQIHFTTMLDSSIDDSAIVLEYSEGHMVRRSLADVRRPSP